MVEDARAVLCVHGHCGVRLVELSSLEGAHGRVGRCDDALVGTTTASMAACEGW